MKSTRDRHLAIDGLSFVPGGHLQTLIGLLNAPAEPPSYEQRVPLADGDAISLQVSDADAQKQCVVLLLHGLCGSHHSPYMRYVAKEVVDRGYPTVRMNMRGWGSGRGLARHIGHSGRSEDLLAVLRVLTRTWNRILVIGFSMGGNIALKAAAEADSELQNKVAQCIAVCPPLDLLAASQRLHLPANRIYELHFIRRLRSYLAFQQQVYQGFPRVQLSPFASVYEFDQKVTAPLSNFSSAEVYYRQSSALGKLDCLRIPSQVVVSDNDPFIASETAGITYGSAKLIKLRGGGHLGFVTGLRPWKRWLEHYLVEQVEALCSS